MDTDSGADWMAFTPHREAEWRTNSARRLIRILLGATDLYPSHRTEFIKLALWKVTDAERTKYNTRYRSLDAQQGTGRLQHDHVNERVKMADALIAHPNRIDEILDRAVACVVTKDEHERLTAISRLDPHVDGWDRYRRAGITVIDTVTGQPLVL